MEKLTSVQFSVSKILVFFVAFFENIVEHKLSEFLSFFFVQCSNVSMGIFWGPFLLAVVVSFFVPPVAVSSVLLLARAVSCKMSGLFAIEASSFP